MDVYPPNPQFRRVDIFASKIGNHPVQLLARWSSQCRDVSRRPYIVWQYCVEAQESKSIKVVYHPRLIDIHIADNKHHDTCIGPPHPAVPRRCSRSVVMSSFICIIDKASIEPSRAKTPLLARCEHIIGTFQGCIQDHTLMKLTSGICNEICVTFRCAPVRSIYHKYFFRSASPCTKDNV